MVEIEKRKLLTVFIGTKYNDTANSVDSCSHTFMIACIFSVAMGEIVRIAV
jgi:hypothetical protein